MIPRIYCAESLSPNTLVSLTLGQQHYLTTVLRRTTGADVRLFNATDGEWAAVLKSHQKSTTALCTRQTHPPQPGPSLWLCFAPIKKTPIDFLAQKATELGVSALQPLITRHTVVRRINTDRLQSNIIEAAEQTGRTDIPALLPFMTLSERLTTWPPDRHLLFADEQGGTPIAKALTAFQNEKSKQSWGIIIGPEGGFHPEEQKNLAAHPKTVRVSLGQRLLRADTAALAVLACWQALLGDWQDTTFL